MKTLIIFFFTLITLLAGAHFTSGQAPEAALLFAGFFTAILVAWTSRQYDRKFHPLTQTRPLRLPVHNPRQAPPAAPRRLAA